MKRNIFFVSLLLIVFVIFSCGKQEPVAPEITPNEEEVASLGKKGGEEEGDPYILDLMHQINDELAAQGKEYRLGEIHLFTIGQARPSNRILQQFFRWVPGDTRRDPGRSGNDLTFLIDGTFQGTTSGVPAAGPGSTADEIRTTMATWDAEKALKNLSLIENPDPGVDVSVFDEFVEFVLSLPPGTIDPEPAPGFPFAADIVNVGWYPRALFDVLGGGDFILAVSVTFFCLTDINGDNYLDTAFNEVYYNDNFPNAVFPLSPWTTGQMALPAIDVQTVALHENGHSLGVGHFGRPPNAVMSTPYGGPDISPLPTDRAAMAAVFGSWPNP